MRAHLREAVLVAAAAAAATALFVAPWRPNASTVPLSYPPGMETVAALDAATTAFEQAWGARNLVEGRAWFDAPILHPLREPLATRDARLTEGLWAAPLFLRLEPLTAWGWLLLLSVFATALSAYAMGRFLSGSAWGGAAAATLYAFGPLEAAWLDYSVPLGPLVWVPLVVAALAAFCDRPDGRRGLLLAAAFALAAVERAYNALHLALLAPLVLAAAVARRRVPWGRALGVLAAGALAAAAVLAPLAARYAALHRATGIEREVSIVAAYSADAWSWLATPEGRLVLPFGPRIGPAVWYPSTYLFPGVAALVFAVAGARAFGRRAPETWWLAAGAFALTLGTGERLLWSLGLPPAPVGPYALLRLLPAGRAFRTPATAAPFVTAVLAASGALAAAAWAARGRPGRLAVAALLALSFVEARASIREAAIRPARADDPAYARIAAHPGPEAVVDLPMGRLVEVDGHALEIDALWGARRHGRPTPNGTTATDVPWQSSIAAHLARPRRGETDRLLRALGVRYVVARDPAAVASLEALGLTPFPEAPGGSPILEVPGPVRIPRTYADVQEAMRDADHATLRDPANGRGRIDPPPRVSTAAQAPFTFLVAVVNEGDETWCADPAVFGRGYAVRVGISRWRALEGGEEDPIDFVGHPLTGRGFLPFDVAPGETAVVRMHGHAPRRPGRYAAALRLLVEERDWFPASKAAEVEFIVGPILEEAGTPVRW